MAWRHIKWELGVIILLVLVLPPAAWFYRDYALGKRLEAELAALQAQGMPVSLAEAAPKPVPDDQNAAVLYQQVFRVDFQSNSNACQLPNYSVEEYELFVRFIHEGNAEGEKLLRDLFRDPQTQQCLQTLREGSMRPHSVFGVHWHDGTTAHLPHYALFRAATRDVIARAALAAHDGDITEALEWHAVVLRMSDHVMREPTLLAQLVAVAMQAMSFRALRPILNNNEIPPEAARDLQQCLRQVDTEGAFTNAMVGQRALACDAFAAWFGGNDEPPLLSHGRIGDGLVGTTAALEDALYLSPLGRPLRKTDQLMYLYVKHRAILLAPLPCRLAKARLEALEDEIDSLPAARAPLTRMTSSTHLGFWEKRDRAMANIALCRIVLALKCYRYERGGYPATLQQLQDTLDWPLPEDPFSGTDFIYLPQDDGFIIYSIGPDLADDGGLPERDEFGKLRRDTFDIVWKCTR